MSGTATPSTAAAVADVSMPQWTPTWSTLWHQRPDCAAGEPVRRRLTGYDACGRSAPDPAKPWHYALRAAHLLDSGPLRIGSAAMRGGVAMARRRRRRVRLAVLSCVTALATAVSFSGVLVSAGAAVHNATIQVICTSPVS